MSWFWASLSTSASRSLCSSLCSSPSTFEVGSQHMKKRQKGSWLRQRGKIARRSSAEIPESAGKFSGHSPLYARPLYLPTNHMCVVSRRGSQAWRKWGLALAAGERSSKHSTWPRHHHMWKKIEEVLHLWLQVMIANGKPISVVTVTQSRLFQVMLRLLLPKCLSFSGNDSPMPVAFDLLRYSCQILVFLKLF